MLHKDSDVDMEDVAELTKEEQLAKLRQKDEELKANAMILEGMLEDMRDARKLVVDLVVKPLVLNRPPVLIYFYQTHQNYPHTQQGMLHLRQAGSYQVFSILPNMFQVRLTHESKAISAQDHGIVF